MQGIAPKPYFPLATYCGAGGKWSFRFQDGAGITHPDPDNREYDSDYEATQAMRRFCITRGENPNVSWPYNHSISENISLVA